ncbi:hydrogenase maturation protease [Methylogaea oryzae]|uniref:Hydrogenase maturation protease n=1 Tax=Methylogaea oryzae TaxID=1295382 RepID=A0A8D5ALJ4_9GAMM|nr:hydrogenase maturation protease [Methylogaea oryzae]BBL70185.1 hypothetical protein MoryE10_07910 [Methylogaea oryzae]
MPHAPCLIFAVGNESRGDDALGPLLLREIARRLEAGAASDRYELIEDFQLQVENVLDMAERQLVLFIDAGHGTPAPFNFYRPQPQAIGHSTHALPPEALLPVFEQVLHRPPPPAYVLCIRGERFELGEEVSPQARRHYEAALAFTERLLANATVESWDALAGMP